MSRGFAAPPRTARRPDKLHVFFPNLPRRSPCAIATRPQGVPMPASPNTFVWYELMTTDIAAEAFYQNVVGWTPQVMEGAGVRYTIMSAGGRPVAGLVQANAEMCEAGARPGWRGYMGVPDVDAATVRLKQSGGTVHREPDDIPGVGRF